MRKPVVFCQVVAALCASGRLAPDALTSIETGGMFRFLDVEIKNAR